MQRPEGATPCDVPRLSQPCEGLTAVCAFCRRTSERPVHAGDKPTDRRSPGGTWCVGEGPEEYCSSFCRDVATDPEKREEVTRRGSKVFAALMGIAAMGDELAPSPRRMR